MVVSNNASRAHDFSNRSGVEFQTDTRLARYQQVAERLRQEITDSHLTPGERLPSEATLAKTHGVALGTVRQAISLLVEEGLIERHQGRGTFVAKPDFSAALARFFRIVDASGQVMRPRGVVTSVALKEAPAMAVHALGLSDGSHAMNIERLRLDGDDVVLIEDIWLEPTRFSALSDHPVEAFEDLLYPQFERECGVIIAHASETLSIDRAGARETSLGVANGDPVVVIERIASGFDGVPVEWRRSVGNAKTFRYQVELR